MEIVTLLIGDPATRFCVDPRLLAASQYFQTALKREWSGGQTRSITIKDIKPAIFNGYLNWQHSRNIFVDEYAANWDILLDYYLLGDRLMHNDFKDAVMDACYHHSLEFYSNSPTFVNKIYSETVPQANMRRFVMNVFAEDRLDVSDDDDYAPLFLIDAWNTLVYLDPSDSVQGGTAYCDYHEHGDNLECYRTRVL